MQPLCPECNTELTPSIVGYICHNCATSHSFEKMATHRAHSSTKRKTTSKSTHLTEIVHKTKKKKIQHKLKNFVVPKIATPYSQTINKD